MTTSNLSNIRRRSWGIWKSYTWMLNLFPYAVTAFQQTSDSLVLVKPLFPSVWKCVPEYSLPSLAVSLRPQSHTEGFRECSCTALLSQGNLNYFLYPLHIQVSVHADIIFFAKIIVQEQNWRIYICTVFSKLPINKVSLMMFQFSQ